MKTIKYSFSYNEYEDPSELDKADIDLINEAREASKNAYAPYSGFSVGAAVRLSGGSIVRGTNVENAAFPSGICAERNAISNSISNFPGDMPVAIAIAASTKDGLTEEPVTPCGNCRQVLSEEEMRNGNRIKIILSGKNRIKVIESCRDLLPLQFNMNND